MAQPDDQHLPGEPDRSLPPCSGESDQRAAPRFTLLIRAAKLIVDETREFLCVIRDASATGMKIRMFHELPPHAALVVEMSNGDRYPVEIVWRDGDFAGVRFTGTVDVERLLHDSHGAYPRRHVRLRIRLDAMLHSGGTAVNVVFHDISQQGACIESEKWLLMNELVRVETTMFPPVYAKVRWRDHPRYGLLFEQTFQLDELARLAGPPRPDSRAVPGPDPRDADGTAPQG